MTIVCNKVVRNNHFYCQLYLLALTNDHKDVLKMNHVG